MTTDFPPAFARQYDGHLKHPKWKGLQPKTIDASARAIRVGIWMTASRPSEKPN